MSDAKIYRRKHDDVQAFVTALTRFLNVCESSGPDYFGVSNAVWTTKPGHESEAARLGGEVDRVAGRAAIALGNEFFISWKPRGTFQTQPVSPATGWRTILDRDPAFTVDVIFAVCNQALGVLDARATDAEEREREAAEKKQAEPARRVRDGRQKSETGGHLRTAIVASLVGIPSALLVAYLVYLFGWA
jgi:hypothetical protein